MKFILPLFISLTCLGTGIAFADTPPNIVLILADDMGYADIGAHGCTDIPTPHIDRIAREGVRFTQAYANGSFCTPTRVALMSGLYQQRTGNDDLPSITGPFPSTKSGVTTMATRLQGAGYTTGLVGKWHLGTSDGFLPLQRGFDEFYGFHGGGHTYFPDRPYRGSYGSPIFRQTQDSKETRYLTDAFGDEAAAFLNRHRDSKNPLFLFLSFNAVHTPLHATEKYLQRFPELTGRRKTYAAMLSAMDDAVGSVLKELDESGKAKSTVLIFHNDNGGPTTRNAVNGSNNTPLRGSKCETFEGGIRVPLAIRWPEVIPSGSTYVKPVMTFDLTATSLALAGVKTEGLDGKNLVPFLTGEENGLPHETLYWRSRTRNNNYAVRHGNWKYVWSTEGTEKPGPHQTPARDLLFDLETDPGETTDLSSKHPDILADLKRRYRTWDAEMDAYCDSLGIKPPSLRGIKIPARAETQAFEATSSFPDFSHLHQVNVRKAADGFQLTSNKDGLLLRTLDKPITGVATFSLDITPSNEFPSNGFLAFGNNADLASTVKCGLLVGGNKLTIYHGAYGSKSSNASLSLVGGKTYSIRVIVDLPAGTVSMTTAGKTLQAKLPASLDDITCVGYSVVRTASQFGEIKTTVAEPK